MMEAPQRESALRQPFHTTYLSRVRTPMHTQVNLATPRSHRLCASSRRTQGVKESEEHSFEGLLKKTWKTFTLSPLYNFHTKPHLFRKFARSLDAALSQEKSRFNLSGGGCEKSSFSLYHGLNFNQYDSTAVRIQVTEKSVSGKGDAVVLTAVMMCVDIDNSPVSSSVQDQFTFYPVILIAGNKLRTSVLLHWLESHFDCRSASLSFSDLDMRWMLAMWSSQVEPVKSLPVLLQYAVDVCEGISTIDCKFESQFCKELWDRLRGDSLPKEEMNELEVNRYVNALEEHLEYTMHILFSKLNLSEVGTSVAYVSSQGKLKMLSSPGVYMVLHLICQIATDRFMFMSL